MIFDTNFLIHLEREAVRGEHGRASQFLARHRGESQAISLISVGEFLAGCADLAAARRFLARFKWLEFSRAVAVRGGILDRELLRRGEPLSENDTWIVATALANNRPLVTEEDFSRVRGLTVVSY